MRRRTCGANERRFRTANQATTSPERHAPRGQSFSKRSPKSGRSSRFGIETASCHIRGFSSERITRRLTNRRTKRPTAPTRPPEARGVECIEVVHLADGPNDIVIFRRAVSALESLLQKYQRVVVHCRAGRSRSIAVVATHLKKAQGFDATDALEFVKSKRPSAPAPELVRLVERFLKPDAVCHAAQRPSAMTVAVCMKCGQRKLGAFYPVPSLSFSADVGRGSSKEHLSLRSQLVIGRPSSCGNLLGAW